MAGGGGTEGAGQGQRASLQGDENVLLLNGANTLEAMELCGENACILWGGNSISAAAFYKHQNGGR